MCSHRSSFGCKLLRRLIAVINSMMACLSCWSVWWTREKSKFKQSTDTIKILPFRTIWRANTPLVNRWMRADRQHITTPRRHRIATVNIAAPATTSIKSSDVFFGPPAVCSASAWRQKTSVSIWYQEHQLIRVKPTHQQHLYQLSKCRNKTIRD